MAQSVQRDLAGVRGTPEAVEWVRRGYLMPYRGNTRQSYDLDLRLWFEWCQKNGIQPLEARRIDIESYDAEAEEQGLKPSTRQRKLIAICGFYLYAEQEEIIDKSPGRYVRRPRVPQVSNSAYLERFEIGPFIAAAKERSPRHSALCHLLLYNGLRVSEAVSADIEDLSFVGGHRMLHIIRKGGKEVDVPLAPPTFRSVLLVVGERENGPLLLDHYGQRMTRDTAARAVRIAAKYAGISKKIGPHALRHTWISLLLDAGVPLRDVQVDAGHAYPSTTIRYDRRSQNPDRHATYIFSAYVGLS